MDDQHMTPADASASQSAAAQSASAQPTVAQPMSSAQPGQDGAAPLADSRQPDSQQPTPQQAASPMAAGQYPAYPGAIAQPYPQGYAQPGYAPYPYGYALPPQSLPQQSQMPQSQPMQRQPDSQQPTPQPGMAPVQPMQPQPMQQSLPPLLLGTYTPKIDAKGRLALPAKLRAQLGDGLIMARGQERCVYLLPQSEFRRIAMQIQRTSMGDKAARDYLRVFLSGAVDQDPDKQGRILIPQMLRDYADLDGDVVVIGVGTRAEIWNAAAWERYLADQEQGYADIADDVLPSVGL